MGRLEQGLGGAGQQSEAEALQVGGGSWQGGMGMGRWCSVGVRRDGVGAGELFP